MSHRAPILIGGLVESVRSKHPSASMPLICWPTSHWLWFVRQFYTGAQRQDVLGDYGIPKSKVDKQPQMKFTCTQRAREGGVGSVDAIAVHASGWRNSCF